MLYYLTGMATERSAVLAYNLLHRGTLEMGEDAIAETVIGPIKRQEPGHYAFYQLSARGLWAELAAWQRWMVRLMRQHLLRPGRRQQRHARRPTSATVLATLGIADDTDDFAGQISRVERELLWARDRGLKVPDYVAPRLPRGGRAGPRPRPPAAPAPLTVPAVAVSRPSSSTPVRECGVTASRAGTFSVLGRTR